MNLTFLEVVFLGVQILLIPFFRYILDREKDKITSALLGVLNEHYLALEALIEHNKDKINKLEDNIKHRSELSKIKQEILHARIKDIELYLQKKNGFQTRGMNQIDDNGFL